jgi:hypothetical protein
MKMNHIHLNTDSILEVTSAPVPEPLITSVPLRTTAERDDNNNSK